MFWVYQHIFKCVKEGELYSIDMLDSNLLSRHFIDSRAVKTFDGFE